MICTKKPWHVNISLTLLNSSEWRSLLCWLLQISIIPEACLAFKICTQLCFQSQPAPEWLLVTNALTFKKLGITLRVRGDAHFNRPLSSVEEKQHSLQWMRKTVTVSWCRFLLWKTVFWVQQILLQESKMILGYAIGYVVKRKIHPKAHWAYFSQTCVQNWD